MALNMFSIEETKLRSGSSSATTPTTYRSVAQVTIITLMFTEKYGMIFQELYFQKPSMQGNYVFKNHGGNPNTYRQSLL